MNMVLFNYRSLSCSTSHFQLYVFCQILWLYTLGILHFFDFMCNQINFKTHLINFVNISFFSFVEISSAWFKSWLHFKEPKFDHNFFPWDYLWDWWRLEKNMDNTFHWWWRRMHMLATNVDPKGLELQCQNFVTIIWF